MNDPLARLSDPTYCLRQIRIAQQTLHDPRAKVQDLLALETSLRLLLRHGPRPLRRQTLALVERVICRRVALKMEDMA